jgi:hypothetical protein
LINRPTLNIGKAHRSKYFLKIAALKIKQQWGGGGCWLRFTFLGKWGGLAFGNDREWAGGGGQNVTSLIDDSIVRGRSRLIRPILKCLY